MVEDLSRQRSKDEELLMIPGPVNFDRSVLSEMCRRTESHMSRAFASTFGETLKALRKVFLTARSEVIVTAGSGTTAMEMVAVNLIEKGDDVLVISHGFFGDRFVKILNCHGIQPQVLSVEWGQRVSPETLEAKLEGRDFKAVTVTHVDTSTGILAPVKEFGKILRKRNTLLIVDGVSSVGGQELRMDDWNVDVCITASQKAIGVPPGLAIVSIGDRAVEAWRKRNSPVECYNYDFENWLPVMKAYDEGFAAYFATPPVNLIYALHRSCEIIVKEGMDDRFKRHRAIAEAFRAAMKGLGLKTVPVKPEYMADTISAIYYPNGVADKTFQTSMEANGVVVAGGLEKLKGKIFRVGHMGQVTPSHILKTVSAIEKSLKAQGYRFKPGVGVMKARETLEKHGLISAKSRLK